MSRNGDGSVASGCLGDIGTVQQNVPQQNVPPQDTKQRRDLPIEQGNPTASGLTLLLRALAGLLFCLGAALAAARLFLHSPLRQYVPLGFVLVLCLLAPRFSAIVTLAGAVLAALVFAYRLYTPLGSIHVQDDTARQSLAWMILCGIALSFLLRPTQRHSRY